MSKAHRVSFMMTHDGLQLEEACGNGWVIPFIASLWMDHYFKHGYSSSNALKKVPKALEGLTDSSQKKEFRIGKARETGLGHKGMLSRSMKSNKKRSWVFIGLMVWMLTLLCSASQADIRLKLTENENESGSSWQHLLVGCALILRMPVSVKMGKNIWVLSQW